MAEDLILWLRKQLDEDELIAQEASERSAEWRLVTPLDDAELGDAWWLNPPEKYHAERHDPARVLREIDAKRQLLGEILAGPHATVRPGGSTEIYCAADSDPGEPCECGRDARVSRYVRLLALPYTDRPGFREEWRP